MNQVYYGFLQGWEPEVKIILEKDLRKHFLSFQKNLREFSKDELEHNLYATHTAPFIRRGGSMRTALIGFLAGATSGVVMGLVSHICFRLRIFKSSLIVIDGSFFLRTLQLQDGQSLIFGTGLLIHLVTSGVFGALFVIAADFLGFNALSLPLVSLYVVLLWLSMLFIALPVSGEGILGRKSGPLAWLEQLILHMVFGGLYYMALEGLL